MTSDPIHDTIEQRLRAARQRYTAGRRRLVELLADHRRPLTIPEILELDAHLSQSSVYRNLQVLELVDAVRRIVTPSESGARYELDEDLTSHHHHLVCTGCGAVQDVDPSGALEAAVQGLTEAVERDTGFDAVHHRLDLVGTCADCR